MLFRSRLKNSTLEKMNQLNKISGDAHILQLNQNFQREINHCLQKISIPLLKFKRKTQSRQVESGIERKHIIINKFLRSFRLDDHRQPVIHPQLTLDDLLNLTMQLRLIQHQFKSQLRREDELNIERCKLLLLMSFYSSLDTDHPDVITSDPEPSLLKKIFGYGYSAIGALYGGANGMNGSINMLGALSLLSSPVAFGISAGLGFISGIFFLGFEAKGLRDALGLIFSKTQNQILQTDIRQLELIRELQIHLVSEQCAREHSYATHKKFRMLMTILHEDFQNKIELLKKENENKKSIGRKLAKGVVGALGLTLSAGSGFFAGKLLLTLLGFSALLSNPVGWAICGLGVFIFLTCFICLNIKSLFKMIDNVTPESEKLEAELAGFHERVDTFNKKSNNLIEYKRTNSPAQSCKHLAVIVQPSQIVPNVTHALSKQMETNPVSLNQKDAQDESLLKKDDETTSLVLSPEPSECTDDEENDFAYRRVTP